MNSALAVAYHIIRTETNRLKCKHLKKVLQRVLQVISLCVLCRWSNDEASVNRYPTKFDSGVGRKKG